MLHNRLGNDEELLSKLAAFHEDRGTTLDKAPRVNGKPIDLARLYRIVIDLGGYDQVSREKLAWRKVGQEFNLGATNAAAYAFALKTVYYKNLAAYEIRHLHNKTPPPRRILEDISAKGGDLLSRTVGNFRQATVEDAEASGDDELKTPDGGGDKMDLDEPGSGTGRSIRGLRQAPPQRVLFQPDVAPSRQTRPATSHGQSPQPTTAASPSHSHPVPANQNNLPASVANYEPKAPIPLTLRGVETPANNPIGFYQKVNQTQGPKRKVKDMTKPGCGFDGPNIYVRTLQALRSGIPGEEEFALYHLTKISHERGDKFKFEAFPMLAEALTEQIVGITSEYYDIHWKVDYQERDKSIDALDGINGTPDLVERLASQPRIDHTDDLEPRDMAIHFEKVNEAGLTMRNLSLMDDNAKYLSEMAEVRDMLTIILALPNDSRLTELKHYILDITEAVIRFWVMSENDPLYRLLINEVQSSTDRGRIITATYAICRISMNLPQSNNLLSVPLAVIEKLSYQLLLQDEELVGASLDFLYQYTAIPSNVAILLFNSKSASFRLAPFMKELCRLLRHGEVQVQTKIVLQEAIPDLSAEKIPEVPNDLLTQLLQMDEPERSNTWLKSVFEEHKDSEITQIALWQAYQSRFTPYSHGALPNAPGLLPAAEFIKNVSIIFENATAQVVNGQTSKFIIKGIRPRHTPVDVHQQAFLRCHWQDPGITNPCHQYFPTAESLWYHAVATHVGVDRITDSEGNSKWDNSDALVVDPSIDCYWASCHRFTNCLPTNCLRQNKAELARHLHQHLPERKKKKKPTTQQPNGKQADQHQGKTDHTPATATYPFRPNTFGPNNTHDPRLLLGPDGNPLARSEIDELGREAITASIAYWNTQVDERNEPAGLPLSAALVLRNLARNVPKAVEILRSSDLNMLEELLGIAQGFQGNLKWVHGGGALMRAKEVGEWMEELFDGDVGEELMGCLSWNRTLGRYLVDLLGLVRKGKGE
ncbi:MAG: hypothetical protein Q9219_000398 [cf. Caloplaca sp. 3 TL-2023]